MRGDPWLSIRMIEQMIWLVSTRNCGGFHLQLIPALKRGWQWAFCVTWTRLYHLFHIQV